MLHALMLAANGRRQEGVAILDAVARDASAMAWSRLAPAMACALRGERDELLRIMTPELLAAARWDEIFAWWTADCFALVNEREAAIDFIERAVDSGSSTCHCYGARAVLANFEGSHGLLADGAGTESREAFEA